MDQDSLDGQLPSSSRSLVHNDPSGITPSPTALAAPPPAPPPMNFAKGKFFRFQKNSNGPYLRPSKSLNFVPIQQGC